MFKIIVAGGRNFSDRGFLRYKLDQLTSCIPSDRLEIVSGGARGADSLGEEWATERGVKVTKFEAEWGRHGRKAGPIRNRQMAEYADALVAFPGGRGTMNMIETAKGFRLDVRVVGDHLIEWRWVLNRSTNKPELAPVHDEEADSSGFDLEPDYLSSFVKRRRVSDESDN